MLHQQLLDFLSAYHPRYLCPPCLATLLDEPEGDVWVLLTQATTSLQFATADCLNCRVRAHGVRFRTEAFNSRAGRLHRRRLGVGAGTEVYEM
jgi:uncharacterized integral membrane protein